MRTGSLVVLVVAAGLSCSRTPPEPGRDVAGGSGAVTSDHPLATQAGLQVLREGGNAMDAAITMAAMLAVARPHMNGLGGDMFLLYYDAASKRTYALNASGPAGRLATLDKVRAGDRTRTAMPETGAMTVTVPGAARGWEAALQRFGSYTWAKALEPAVRLAKSGLPVSARLSADIAEEERKLLGEPAAAKIYLPGGAAPVPGSVLKQDDLAATLAQISVKGADELYVGEIGRQLASYVQSRGGFLSVDDLAGFSPEWVDPLSITYHGLTVQALPPNSQGVTLLETLGVLDHLDLVSLGQNTPDYLHTVADALRLTVADRDSTLAEPAAMRTQPAALLAPAHLTKLAKSINPKGRAPAVARRDQADHPNTVYIIAVDSRGNAVSMMQSLYASFGSGLVVPGLGIVLHNRGALFSLDASHPNALAPGKRPFHTLTPALALDHGVPRLVFGTPGGDGQVHTLVQVLNNIVLFGMSPQDAIDAPRLRRLPTGELSIEDRVPEAVRAALVSRGYTVTPKSGWTAEFGGAQAVWIAPRSGERRAGADRRREAWALAY
jgi:gamma-glutamyltranspeptidase/glutathione hydrolase